MTTTLVMIRHGQSTWNLENLFTGWTDVELTDRGIAEAETAGSVLAAEGYGFDVVHTSVLVRAIRTAEIVLHRMGLSWIDVRRHWRLNERHYGALQGLNKKETADRHGAEQVRLWRRSYDVPPPPLSPTTRGIRGMTRATPSCHPTRYPPPSAWPMSWIGCCPIGTTRSSQI